MNKSLTVILPFAVALGLSVVSGCTVQENTKYGPVEQVATQKQVENHVDLALRYISRGNRELARNHLTKALELDSDASGAYTGYALLYEQEGESELAEENFRKAIRNNGADTRARFYYGIYLNGQERFNEALDVFQQVVKNVDYPHRALAFVSLGQVNLKLGRSEQALTAFERAIRINPQLAAAYLEMSDLHYLAGRYQQARLYLNQFSQLSRPTARSLWLGVRLEHRFRNRDAEASYGLALKNLFPNSKENLAYQEWLEHAE